MLDNLADCVTALLLFLFPGDCHYIIARREMSNSVTRKKDSGISSEVLFIIFKNPVTPSWRSR